MLCISSRSVLTPCLSFLSLTQQGFKKQGAIVDDATVDKILNYLKNLRSDELDEHERQLIKLMLQLEPRVDAKKATRRSPVNNVTEAEEPVQLVALAPNHPSGSVVSAGVEATHNDVAAGPTSSAAADHLEGGCPVYSVYH